MHPKVFVKLEKTLKTLSSGQKNPKNPKKPKKPKKTQKNPLGWVFLKKPGFFPTLIEMVIKSLHPHNVILNDVI
jgi:hypothetical protein